MHFDVFILFFVQIEPQCWCEGEEERSLAPSSRYQRWSKPKLVQLEVLLLPLVSHQALLPPADTQTDALGPRSPAASLTIHAFICSIWIWKSGVRCPSVATWWDTKQRNVTKPEGLTAAEKTQRPKGFYLFILQLQMKNSFFTLFSLRAQHKIYMQYFN